MRSGRIQEEDRVVWVGDDAICPVGSSMKAREVTRTHVAVDPINGTYEERLNDLEWWRRGVEIVSCREAAKRGIEPWATALDKTKQRPLRPRRPKPTGPVAFTSLDVRPETQVVRGYIKKWQEYKKEHPEE